MSESTLSITYDDLRSEIGYYLGFRRSSSAWSADQAATIESCLKSGLRQFYLPEPLPGESVSHLWSFLKPLATLVVWAGLDPVATTTCTGVVASGNTTLTATAGVFFPSMIGHAISITGITGTWTILSYTSSTVVVVEGEVPTPDTPRTFFMAADGNYTLPDDFGSFDSVLTLDTPELGGVIPITGESIIRQRRQQSTAVGRPTLGAIVFRSNPSSTTQGQRQQLMLYPTPETNYTISYRYRVIPDALTALNKYPYGGAQHAEALIASCLAAAERRVNDAAGVKYDDWMTRLRAAVSLDRQSGPSTFGYNGDGDGYVAQPPMTVLYNGQ